MDPAVFTDRQQGNDFTATGDKQGNDGNGGGVHDGLETEFSLVLFRALFQCPEPDFVIVKTFFMVAA